MTEKDYLDYLLIKPWQQIVVQGGKLKKLAVFDVYSLSGLWINVSNKWVVISAEDIDWEEDEYCLYIGPLDLPPIPEKLKMVRPPRKVLENCPPDCDLMKILEHGVKNIQADHLERHNEGLWCHSPLIITSGDGSRFEITASLACLAFIELRELD